MTNVIAVLNPITRERVKTSIPSGKSLFDSMKVPDDVVIDLNGNPYNGEPLQDDDLINLIVVPKGGDTGKDIARTGILIAAQVAAAALTANMSTFAQIGIRAGVHIAASAGANRLIPLEVN